MPATGSLAGLNTVESFLNSEWGSVLSLSGLTQFEQSADGLNPNDLYPTALGSSQIVLTDGSDQVTINGSGFSLTITSIAELESISSVEGALSILSSGGGTLSSVVLSNGSQVATLAISSSSWVVTSGSETLTISGSLPTGVATVATALQQLFTSSGQLNPSFNPASSVLNNYDISSITLADNGTTQASLNWSGSTLTATTGDYSISITGNLPTTAADVTEIAVKQSEGGGATGFTLNSGTIAQISTGQTIASLNFNGADFGSTNVLTNSTGSIIDVAANISANLDDLNAIGGTITISDNGAVGVSSQQVTNDLSALSRLQDANGSAVQIDVTTWSALPFGVLSVTDQQATADTWLFAEITNPLFEAIAPSLPPTYYAGGNGATGTPIAFSASNSSVNLKANSNMALTGSSNSVYSGANSTFSATGGSDYLDLLGSGDSVSLSGTSGNWDWIDGSNSSVTLNGGQSDVNGGGNTIAYASGSGDAADLYNTGGSADTVTATGGAVYLNSAQAKVTGGGDWVDFQGGSGNAVTLAGTNNSWDWVTAAGGTVDFNGAQATIAGGGDTIAFTGGSGNSLAITGTGGSADSITASSSNVYMLGAQAKVTGGGDWVDFQSGTDSVTLANTNSSWDWVTAAGGTVDFNGAQATVAGGDDTIAFVGGSGNSVALTGTGGSADSLTASNSAVYLLGAQANVTGGGDWVDFQSGTDSVTLAATNNNWDWVTAAGGNVNLNSAQSVVQGGGDTIALTGTGSAVTLTGTGGSADTVTSSNGLLYLNGAQAHVSGNSNTLYMGGSTATASGNSDSFAFLAGFGQDSVTGFNSTDTIQLPAADFASWNALQSHMTQSGANTVIALDASDAITLVGVTKSSLTQAEFSFK